MNISSSIFDCYFDSLVSKQVKKYKNKAVVIFDDLERISDRLDITDLLGTIHTKLALNGVKVIYIANDEEIKESDNEKFNKEKEKYIQRILSFETDKNAVFVSFLNDYKINSQDFMIVMNNVFSEKQINLRTVKFCLECYKEIKDFSKNLPSDEYYTPETLFYSICQIGNFYRNGYTDKELLKKELESYYIKKQYSKNNEKQKDDYEIFAESYGSNLIREGFIFDLIFDGIFNEEEVMFYLRKPKFNQDPLFALVNVLDMETFELKEYLTKVIQNLKSKKYTIMQYGTLRDSFLPNVLKTQLDTEKTIIAMISESIFSENNKKELEDMFNHWIKDSFSRIKKAENDFEIELLERFNTYCKNIDDAKTEDFYQCLIKCDRKIYEYKFEYSIFTSLVKRGYVERILSMSNKSLRYFSYFIDSQICRLINARDFYYSELSALEEIKLHCEEKLKLIEKDDVLKINAINNLSLIVSQAIKQIKMDEKKL